MQGFLKQLTGESH
jgi:hypothetical protein